MAFFFLLTFSFWTGAAEPDNFSARHTPNSVIANSEINRVVNSVLSMATDQFQARNRCDREKFLQFLEDDLDRNFPKVDNYVYLNAPFAGPKSHEETPLNKFRGYGKVFFSPSVKLESKGKTFFVGLDKIDHFFSHGYLYWQMTGKKGTLDKEKVQNALQVGIEQENGPWGLKSSGVKSYADLAANYAGLSFWSQLLDGPSPMIACEKGRFVQKRSFDIANYFNEAMDETINCNSYATKEMLSAVYKMTAPWNMECPVKANACAELKKNYPAEIANKILHPRCLGTGDSQLEEASAKTTKDIIDMAGAAVSGGPQYLLFKMFGQNKKHQAQPQGENAGGGQR